MKTDLTIFESSNTKEYVSIKPTTIDEKKKLYNALEKCDARLNDIVNTEIKIKDFYLQERTVEEANPETGVIEPHRKFRLILFTDDDKSYVTGAYGIYNAICKLVTIFGEPTWEEPIPVKVIKKDIGNNKSSLTLELI